MWYRVVFLPGLDVYNVLRGGRVSGAREEKWTQNPGAMI